MERTACSIVLAKAREVWAMRRIRVIAFFCIALYIASSHVSGDVAGVLARPVLAPDTTKNEWTAFMTKRLPPLQVPASKEAWDQESA